MFGGMIEINGRSIGLVVVERFMKGAGVFRLVFDRFAGLLCSR